MSQKSSLLQPAKSVSWGLTLDSLGYFANEPLLRAVHDDEGRRCHRHAGLGTEGLGARPGKGHPPAKASLRQWLQLHRGGPGEMARRAEHGARPWRALSPDDPRQDRA